MEEAVLAVALVNDGSAQSKEGLLFSVFATDRLRSFLVTVAGGGNDTVDLAFPRLDFVIFQNPTRLTSTQVLGMLLSCESGPSNLCGSVIPVEMLERLSRVSLSHGNLKSFFSMYAEVVPSVAFVETSAHKEPPPVPIRGKVAAHLDSPTEAAVELLLSTMREKLLQDRTSSTSVASPSSSYQTPIKAARHFMEPNPLLDQWLRGLWGLELDPQSPSLSRISVRLAGATTWSNSATPDTDTSTCSNLDSLRDDANLLIDAKLALVDALSERLPVSRGFRLPQSKSFSSCAEHGLETLWPAVVLAEAFGCQSLLASLLIALKAIVTSTSPLESAYCEDTCAAMGLGMKGDDALRLFGTLAAHFEKFGTGSSSSLVPRNGSGNWSPQTDGECATPCDNTGMRDTLHELHISPIEDDSIDGARGNDPPQPLMSPPAPHNAPGHPLADAYRGASQQSENDDRQQREAFFDRSDSEDDDDDDESSNNGFDDSSEPTGGFDDPLERGDRSRGRYAQSEETEIERRRQDGTASLRPSPTDFEPELGPPRGSNFSHLRHNQSGFDAFNCSSSSRGSFSSSFIDSNLSRSLATMRVQPQLREKRAQEASKAAEKALRASRLKSVELAQRMARVGWGNRSMSKSSHDRVALDHAAVRQSWSDLLEQEARAAVRAGETITNSYSSTKVNANRSVLSASINPPLSESAAAAQRRAAQRVKERSRQMLTKQQLATIEKKEREDAMWRERDRRIKLFVERQKGGQLYLMSTGSTPPSEWAGGYSSARSGSGSASLRHLQGSDSDDDEVASGGALAVHKRQPWAVGSPDLVAAKGDRGEMGCSPRASYTLTPTAHHHYGNCDDSDSSDGDSDHNACDGGEINLGFFALREPVEGCVGNGMNHAAEEDNAAVLPPPPPPPLSHVGITVLCARNLNEGLGGCSPYVVLDWSYLGRQSTQPPPANASPSLRSNTNPSFGVKMLFKPPFLWAGVSAGGDAVGNRASSLYDLDRELDGKEVFITTPSKGADSSSVTTAATLCAPILRVYVYSRNISVSDELLGEGEVDVETMLYACQQGLPFTVELFDTVNGKHAAGSVEMRFEL